MKGLPRDDYKCVAVLCFIASVHGMIFCSRPVLVQAQGNANVTADALLAQKNTELNLFVAVVEANSHVLNGCSGEGNCSRLTCYKFGTPFDPSYQCLGVENNTLCGETCQLQRNFDFTKGFVRRVDSVDDHIARTVCTHRFLDDYFRSTAVSNISHFFRVFYGDVDGTLRIYPGADEPCDNSYDPRVRPWYLESTYVPKVVTVLIDSGLNMRLPLSGGTTGETYISKAIATALRLLDTLRGGRDYVNIVCFDGAGVKKLSDPAVYNETVMRQSFNDSLAQIVLNGSTSIPDATHTNDAINATITQLQNSNSIPVNYLKVVIALIGGQQYRSLADLNVSASPNMNLFLYSFQSRPEPECNPSIRASLEEVPDERLNNPLYGLQSYYSFLAKLHIKLMKNQTDYGPRYPDFSGIDASTLTLSKAAFGPSGELLGVLGLDIFQKKIEQQYPSIQFQKIVEEAGKFGPKRIFDTRIDLQDTSVCFNHTDACPSLDASYVPGFLCDAQASATPSIGCLGCDECSLLSAPSGAPQEGKPPEDKPKAKIAGKFVAVIVACGVVGATLVGLVVWKRGAISRRVTGRRRTDQGSPSYQGSPDRIAGAPGSLSPQSRMSWPGN